jgi:hypothetical protein
VGTILDNSCGMGHIAETLKEIYPKNEIIATDKYDYGYGEVGLDFLSDDYPYTRNINCIVMNPPFTLIEEFTVKSLNIVKNKLLLFARIQFAESESRYISIFRNNPPTRVYLYVDRVACAKDGDFSRALSSNMAFSWFVWDMQAEGDSTTLKWLRKWEKQRERGEN